MQATWVKSSYRITYMSNASHLCSSGSANFTPTLMLWNQGSTEDFLWHKLYLYLIYNVKLQLKNWKLALFVDLTIQNTSWNIQDLQQITQPKGTRICISPKGHHYSSFKTSSSNRSWLKVTTTPHFPKWHIILHVCVSGWEERERERESKQFFKPQLRWERIVPLYW